MATVRNRLSLEMRLKIKGRPPTESAAELLSHVREAGKKISPLSQADYNAMAKKNGWTSAEWIKRRLGGNWVHVCTRAGVTTWADKEPALTKLELMEGLLRMADETGIRYPTMEDYIQGRKERDLPGLTTMKTAMGGWQNVLRYLDDLRKMRESEGA